MTSFNGLKLRRHQVEFFDACNLIIEGDKRPVLCHVFPGGGKSLLPTIAAEVLLPKMAKKILWVVPRSNLKHQAAESLPGLGIDEPGELGAVICYQSLDREWLLPELEKVPYIIFLDECHHVREQGVWHKRLRPLLELATHTIMMTGALERGDQLRIAFFPYHQEGQVITLNTAEVIYIEYPLKVARSEDAVIPTEFIVFDAEAEWLDGSTGEIDRSKSLQTEGKPGALLTALETGFARSLLNKGLAHWRSNSGGVGKCLVVAPTIRTARTYLAWIIAAGFNASIATKAEKRAHRTIRSFRDETDPKILVTVAMAYEGMDVPNISHVICLTRIRSSPWLLQCFSRGNRWSKDLPSQGQKCFVFAPSDPLLLDAIDYYRQADSGDVFIPNPGDSVGMHGEHRPRSESVPVRSDMIALSGTRPARRQYDWPEIRKDFLTSGLSIAQYCREKGVPIWSGHDRLKGLAPKINWEEHQKDFNRRYQEDPEFTLKAFAKIIRRSYQAVKQNLTKPGLNIDWAELQRELDISGASVKALAEKYKLSYWSAKKKLKRRQTKHDWPAIQAEYDRLRSENGTGYSLGDFCRETGIPRGAAEKKLKYVRVRKS